MNANSVYTTVTGEGFLSFLNEMLIPHVKENKHAEQEIVSKISEIFGIKTAAECGQRGRVAKKLEIPHGKFSLSDLATANDVSHATANIRLAEFISEGTVRMAEGKRMPRNNGRPMHLYERVPAPVGASAEAVAEVTAAAEAATVDTTNATVIEAATPVAVAETVETPVAETPTPAKKKNKK